MDTRDTLWLHAEIERLRGALEPFAKAADLFAPGYGDLMPLGTDAITVGDLRMAKRALTANKGGNQ